MSKRILALAATAVLTISAIGFGAAATPAEDAASSPGFLNDNDARIVYSGNWGQGASRDVQAEAAGGGRAYTTEEGASATLTFTGTKIQVLMTKKNGNGFVDISIDSGTAQQVNTGDNSTASLWAQTVFTKEGLSEGEHTITITNVNGGYGVGYVYLEGFLVSGSAAPTFPQGTDLSLEEIEESPFFIDDNADSIIYSGGWGKDPDSSSALNEEYAGGQRAYTGTANSSAQLFFTGSHLKVIMSVATADGTAEIYVDGALKRIVSTKATSMDDFNYNTIVYSVDDLDPDTVHNVKISNTENNSWIYLVGFMAEDAVPNPGKYLTEQAPGFINDNAAAIVYSEGWGHGDSRDVKAEAAGDGRAYTTAENATATCTFTGNEIQVVMTMQNGSGFVDISIDGEEPVRINTNSGGDARFAQAVFTKKGLADGEHTIEVKNVKNEDALGYVYLEGFVASERTGPVVLDPEEIEKLPGFINDIDAHLVFKGNWGKGEEEAGGRLVDDAYAGGGCAYLGPDALTEKAGGVALTFEGTEIAVLMGRKSGNGYVDIYLDGKQMINPEDGTGFWNCNTLGEADPNAVIFNRQGLDNGKHTIEVYSADGGYGYGWIYLTGFLTDGRAVDYQEPEEPVIPDESSQAPSASSDPAGGDESDTAENPSPSSPGTGSAAPAAACMLATAAGAVLLTLRKQRTGS